MKNAFVTVVFLAVCAAVFVPRTTHAQVQVKVDIDNIEVALQSTPQFNYAGDTKKLPKAREWVEIEVEFKPEGRSENNYVDGLEFNYYVMMSDKKTMYVGKVTHVNVELGETSFSSMYLSPATLEKLMGREATSDNVVEAVAIEVRHQGALVGGDATEAKTSRWWQTQAQTGNMLLQKSETPFAPLWSDRYAEVQKSR